MRNLGGKRLGHAFEHNGEGSGVRDRCGVRLDGGPLLMPAALRFETAHHVHRLRREAHMAHHGNAALCEKGNGSGHPPPTFELHCAAARFFIIRAALRNATEGNSS